MLCKIYLTSEIMRCILYLTLEVVVIKNETMKTLRLSKKYSQLELAKIVGVSRQTIVSVENGDYNPTLDLCIKICKALEVTLNDLFWREEN